MIVILYEVIFDCFNKYTAIITNTFIFFMWINIGVREIAINKNKIGYYILSTFLAIMMILLYKKRV